MATNLLPLAAATWTPVCRAAKLDRAGAKRASGPLLPFRGLFLT